MNVYGIETIIDLHNCNTAKFNRRDIKTYFALVCKLLDVRPEDCYFWDDLYTPEEKQQTEPKTKGTTAIQFILTSNITIHTLDLLATAFVNVFSCKDYDPQLVEEATVRFFNATQYQTTLVARETL